jgi:heptosyltransferase-2
MRFLIIKLAAIGDVIMGTAMIRALRDRHAACHITWLVGGAAHGLTALIPGIDRLILVDDRAVFAGTKPEKIRAVLATWRHLAGQRFDGIFIAHTDPRYQILALPALGPKHAITAGYGATGQRGRLIPGRHHSVEYARLVTGTDGPAMDAGALPALDPATYRDAFPLQNQTRPYAILAAGGAKNPLRDSPQRRWPTENYAAIARSLLARGLDVILVGAASDDWVLPYFDGLPIHNLIAKTTWSSLLALTERAALILTHDSMMAHLPRFFTTPTIVLFGPTPPTSFFYPSPNFHLVETQTHLPCRPCYDTNEFFDCPTIDCMNSISVSAVMAKIETALATP